MLSKNFTFAITGDTILNRKISVCSEEGFLSLVRILREADVAFTHLETLIHDYDGPDVYPAAESGWTWMRSPRFVVGELKWMGFDLVSHASNHSLDYSYGGLVSTWKALDEDGIPYAGTGRNLSEAREPAYLETDKGRVALISMCSSFARWARAGESRRDVKGRPGLNPLGFHYAADARSIQRLKELAIELGWWVTKIDQTWLFNPAGLHNTLYRFVEDDRPGIHSLVDEDDAEDNLRSIRTARRQADFVLVHLHTHEWDPRSGLSVPAEFVPSFARNCIDAGADVFVGEGSHATLRGIEVHKNRPIFYDPGDFINMNNTVTRLPSDFYWRTGYNHELRRQEATVADAFDARAALPQAVNPPGGYRSAKVVGSVIGLCSFDADHRLVELRLQPLTMIRTPRSRSGLPLSADPETSKKIIEYLAELSASFGTKIEFKDGVGLVDV